MEGFPGGSVVKNLPASAGDMGLIPDPGRSHMLQSNKACAPQLLGLCRSAQEPQLLKPHPLKSVLHDRRHCSENSVHHNWNSPCSPQLEKIPGSNKDPAESTGKINKIIK